ncbi:hypothetical protein SLS53_003924 [Cytospora paraplurivora]|uniref:Uncharacterized protein n=1 Tax=Cytospora paraplurivora TaxID=2898453 RepID=A0AAN9U9Y5_9PEZI
MTPLQATDFIKPSVTNAPNPSSLPDLTISDVDNAPNPGVMLSRFNSRVCDIVVNGVEMCGAYYVSQRGFRRHLRTRHPGAITTVDQNGISPQETTAGIYALRRWVLSLGWRNARYSNEPGRGSLAIAEICDKLERIAAQDSDFAAQYGKHFHRRIPENTSSLKLRE